MGNPFHVVVDLAVIAILLLGIWQFRTPQGARLGNLTAALSLLCAAGVVFYRHPTVEPWLLVAGAFLVGGFIGWLVAMRVTMIQIPAMVAFQHGAGGIAAVLVSSVELTRSAESLPAIGEFAGLLGVVIGGATFSGSMIASGKLANVLRQTPTVLPRHFILLLLNLLGVLALCVLATQASGRLRANSLLGLVMMSVLLGIIFSIRIGGADMPVLISFLNATAGLAAAFCGIIIQNRLLIACGATVAASGSILTHVMCRAMNRSLLNLLLGIRRASPPPNIGPAKKPSAMPVETAARQDRDAEQSPLRRAVEAARAAQKVILIPGYGMALAHAQLETVQLANKLRRMGKDVKFAIHPIAGRMPGHMHVLLAEANVDSDLLFDMDEINSEFSQTDLVLIVGACDVVNPAAINVPDTPIAGMPILAAHEAKHVVVCNLDARPGYSGVGNPLYTEPKTVLMFGDAKATLSQLTEALG